MPHGGYHGTIAVNPGTTLAVGQGSGLTIGPDRDDKIIGGQSVLTNQGIQNVGGSAPSTTESIEKQIEDKKKQIEALNLAQSGSAGLFGQGAVAGATGIDAINLAKQQNLQNELLNNLLIQQAQAEARERILSQATPSQVDVEQGFGIVPKLRKADLTGFEGGPFGLNIPAFGAIPSTGMSGIRTLENPFTGEILFSTDPKNPGSRQDELLKARLGLTTPQYNDFISKLYDANPELFEETFPLESGKLVQPILARLLEGGLMKDAGRLAGNVREGIGSFVDTITGSRFTPTGGTVRPSDVGAPSDTGGVTLEKGTPKANNNPFNIPSAFTGFYESDFYNPNAAGGQAITPVTLPDGTVVRFPNTAIGGQFIQYLESLGISQPPATGVDAVKDTPQPTGISAFDVDKFYASLPQYTQQGIMAPANLSRFTDALKMFPGMA